MTDPNGTPAPDPRLLIDYVDGVLPREEAQRVERYVEASGAWRAELELARSFASTPAAEAPEDVSARAWAAVDPAVVPLAPRRRVWLPPLLAAASLAILFVAARTWWESRPVDDGGAMRSVSAEVDLPLAAVPAKGGWRLDWSPPAGVSGVRLVVTDVAGRIVHEEPVPDPRSPFLDASRLPEMEGPLLARLLGVGPEGEEVRSGLAEVTGTGGG